MKNTLIKLYTKISLDAHNWNIHQLMWGENYFGLILTIAVICLLVAC
jgi:hypothetical protein